MHFTSGQFPIKLIKETDSLRSIDVLIGAEDILMLNFRSILRIKYGLHSQNC